MNLQLPRLTYNRGSRTGDGDEGGFPIWKATTVGLCALLIIFTVPAAITNSTLDIDGDGIPNLWDFWFNPPPTNQTGLLSGELVPTVEPYASDDSTDVDGAGTWEIWRNSNNPTKYEPALTWGTHTKTTIDYESGQSFWFVCKSTTANAADHFSWLVTLPYEGELASPVAHARDSKLYYIEWDSVNDRWDLHLYCGQEATITTKAYTVQGVEVGTTAIDMSDHDSDYIVTCKITIATNYDAIYKFFDPDEGSGGKMDSLYVLMTSNVTAANMGFSISTPSWMPSSWVACESGNDFYLCLDEFLPTGMLVRWDEEGMYGVLEFQFAIHSSDLDTSGAGALLLTLGIHECQDQEDLENQTLDSDTLGNYAGADTEETATFQD
jgi:hypothetical protein